MNITETPILTTRFEEALIYATRLHQKQIRKATNIPYISHLLAVIALVLENGGDEDQAIAAFWSLEDKKQEEFFVPYFILHTSYFI